MGRKVDSTIYRGGIGWAMGPDLGDGMKSLVWTCEVGMLPGHSWIQRSLGPEVEIWESSMIKAMVVN